MVAFIKNPKTICLENNKIIFVTGGPASGKSHIIKNTIKENSTHRFFVFNDCGEYAEEINSCDNVSIIESQLEIESAVSNDCFVEEECPVIVIENSFFNKKEDKQLIKEIKEKICNLMQKNSMGLLPKKPVFIIVSQEKKIPMIYDRGIYFDAVYSDSEKI